MPSTLIQSDKVSEAAGAINVYQEDHGFTSGSVVRQAVTSSQSPDIRTTVLYEAGDEKVAITGGWVLDVNTGSPTLNSTASGLEIQAPEWSDAILHPVNTLDFTHCIKIVLEWAITGGVASNCYFRYYTDASTTVDIIAGGVVEIPSPTVNTNPYDLRYYIANTKNETITITKIWMEEAIVDGWVLAKADDVLDPAVGVVLGNHTTDAFMVALSGVHQLRDHGLEVHRIYYLSDTEAGGLVLEPPLIIQPVVYTIDESTILVIPPVPQTDSLELPILSRHEFLSTEGLTRVNVSYLPENVDVIVNGRTLPPSEYTATTGTYIDFVTPLTAGLQIVVVSYGKFDVGSVDADYVASTATAIALALG